MSSLFVTLQILAGDVRDRLRGERGATAVEYGLLVGLIAVVIIGTVATPRRPAGRPVQDVSDALAVAP